MSEIDKRVRTKLEIDLSRAGKMAEITTQAGHCMLGELGIIARLTVAEFKLTG